MSWSPKGVKGLMNKVSSSMILQAQNRTCLDRSTLISSLLLPGSLKQN